MQNIQQIFRKNINLWTQKQRDDVENFFISNKYIGQFYQKRKLDQIARICLYRILRPGQKLILQNNNRSEAIILIEGDITVKKKQRGQKKRSKVIKDEKQQKKKDQLKDGNFQYIFLAQLKKFNETIKLNSQSIIQSQQKTSSHIIFIPCSLFYKLQEEIENERVQKIQQVIQKFFFKLKRKEMHQLSKANCQFRQFKMNNYIYRASSKPQEMFILLEGILKLQKPGFSQENLKETILISAGRIFGQSDLKLQERTRNAVACSAHVQVLAIPKNQFLKYQSKAFPDMIFQSQITSTLKLPLLNNQSLKISRSLKLQSEKKKPLLPFLNKRYHFHESSIQDDRKKSESQQKRQYQLIKNSHMLLDIKENAKKKFQIRKFSPKSKQQLSQIMNIKRSRINQLRRQSRFSLDNSLVNL